MTATVSTTKRKVLDNYYTYSVGFVHWENFASDVSVEDLEEQASLTQGSWASLLVKVVKRSFGMGLLSTTRHRRTARSVRTSIQRRPQEFWLYISVVNGSGCDVQVLEQVLEQTTPFIFPEGKKSGHLLRRPTNRPQELRSELCLSLSGIVTKIART
jgi:hypothetical protein